MGSALRRSGTWEGKTTELDERTFNETEADVAVSRIYSKDGRSLNFLLAEYKQPVGRGFITTR